MIEIKTVPMPESMRPRSERSNATAQQPHLDHQLEKIETAPRQSGVILKGWSRSSADSEKESHLPKLES